jgi:hypothetical protein
MRLLTGVGTWRRIILAVALAAGSGVYIGVASAHAGARQQAAKVSATGATCHPRPGRGPTNRRHVPIKKVRVDVMSCADALAAIYRGRITPQGQFSTPQFSCRSTHLHMVFRHGREHVIGASVDCRGVGFAQFSFHWGRKH